jgi:hypothetical protein
MGRNYGITSPTISGGNGQSPGSHSRGTQRDSNVIQLASRDSSLRAWPNSEGSNLPFFIPHEPPLERGKVSQALFDIGAVVAACVVVSLTGIGLGISLFILFFVAV